MQSLVLEDSTCCGYLSLGKTTTEPKATPTEACVPRACALQQEKTAHREVCALQPESIPSPQLEKAHV